jgi:acyl dehydratase
MTIGQASQSDDWDVLESYVAELNDIVGKRGPAPLFADSLYAFAPPRTMVTEDLIKEFARGHGDLNPMWLDPAYGTASQWRTMIAPPLFEICFGECASFPIPPSSQLKDCKIMLGGFRRNYYQPIRPGDTLRSEDIWHGIEDKSRPGKPHRMYLELSERLYINQDDTVVCSCFTTAIVIVARAGSGRLPGKDHSDRRRRRYTQDEFDAVHRDYQREITGENRRAQEPRWWEEVEIGDSLPAMLKGPYDIFDCVSHASLLGFGASFASKWAIMERFPELCPIDSEVGYRHTPATWHFLDSVAQEGGFPYATAFGTHVDVMLVHPVTNWMGDTGFVVQTDTQIRSPLMLGEITQTTGEVVAKVKENDDHFVDLALTSTTLDGVEHARTNVRVRLPSRMG